MTHGMSFRRPVSLAAGPGRRWDRRRLAALLMVLLGSFGVAVVFAAPASAHAMIVSSDPPDGARLVRAPGMVTISFDEPVGLGGIGYLHVTDQDGRAVDTGTVFHPVGDGTKIADRLRPGLGNGSYTESYRVISADSHPVVGAVRFTVGSGAQADGASSDQAMPVAVDQATAVVFGIARWVSFAGFAGLGAAWLLLSVWPQGLRDRRARLTLCAAWSALVVGCIAELFLQSPYTAGRGLSALADPSLLNARLLGGYGMLHLARLVVLLALAVLLAAVSRSARPRPAHRRFPRWRHAVWPLGVALALTFSLVGHPDTTDPRWLSISVDAVHLIAMSAWIGGLVMLIAALLPSHRAEQVRRALPVISRVSFTAVIVIAASGAYSAWRGIGSLDAFLTTRYGLLVAIKVALFGGLLALGNLSRIAIQRRLTRVPAAPALVGAPEPDGAVAVAGQHLEDPALPATPTRPGLTSVELRRMRRSVLAEIALAILVLAASAILVVQPRGPEALAASHRHPIAATAGFDDGHQATVIIDPGIHGTVVVDVTLSSGTPVGQVTATATQPVRQLGPIPIPLHETSPGRYGASGVQLPVAGRWVIDLTLTTSEFRAVTTQAEIELY